MPDGTCMVCGRIIPEGRHICLSCMGQEMQSFQPKYYKIVPARGNRKLLRMKQMLRKRYFRIVDDCGWVYHIATDNNKMIAANIALLVPHVRSAAEISREEFEEAQT